MKHRTKSLRNALHNGFGEGKHSLDNEGRRPRSLPSKWVALAQRRTQGVVRRSPQAYAVAYDSFGGGVRTALTDHRQARCHGRGCTQGVHGVSSETSLLYKI